MKEVEQIMATSMTTTRKKPAAKSSSKTAAKKPVAKKAVAGRKNASGRVVPKKKVAAKPAAKTTTKKPAAKPVAKKTVATKKPAAKKPAAKKAPLTGQMLVINNMAKAVSKALDEAKAEEIITIDLTSKSALADYIVVATGRSGRQVAALARFAEEALHKAGAKRCRIEGAAQGDWVIVDSGDVVVHLFRPEVREFYQLEKLWSDDDTELTTHRSLA